MLVRLFRKGPEKILDIDESKFDTENIIKYNKGMYKNSLLSKWCKETPASSKTNRQKEEKRKL